MRSWFQGWSDEEFLEMPDPSPKKDWLYTDISGGYTFTQHDWKQATIERPDWRERLTPDALAHRAEALRRRVVCRLSDRKIEADHWFAMQRYLENLFRLPEVADG